MFKRLALFIVLVSATSLYAQQAVTIYWDASLSMKDRTIEKEIKFLDSYFTRNKSATVTLISFNNEILEKETTSINNGNWLSVKEKLKNMTYDGGTSYHNLSSHHNGGDILFFTDGHQNITISNPKFEGLLYIINTNPNFNEETLKRIALMNKGRLVNLATMPGEISSQKQELLYTGQVFYENKIANDISVSLKNSNQEVQVDSNGSYAMSAKQGDTIIFKQDDRTLAEMKLGSNLATNVWIEAKGIRLEKVLIIADIKEEKKEQVVTSTGIQDKEPLGYAVQTLKKENFNVTATTISEAIDGKFTGLSKGSGDDISQTVIRGMNTFSGNNYAAISIDGVIIAQSSSFIGKREFSDFVDINNVAEITVLKGYAATVLYGSEGRNGVILITTKTAQGLDIPVQKENTALVKNNIYDGKAAKSKETSNIAYLKGLRKASSVASEYQLYLNEREKYWDDPSYFIDVFDLFATTNEALAFQIISNILERENSSFALLRSMYLKVSEKGNSALALDVATTLLNKFPQQTQSYMDVAIAHKDAANYQAALDILLAIADGSINPNLDFTGLQKIANNEIKSLVKLRKGVLNTSKIRVHHSKVPNLDARIVFDWNNSDAEFELQFVNPSKRFFKWSHTIDNAERIQDEFKNGYNQEEFEIEGGDKGEWIINVKYLGNRTPGNKDATFLKYMVQYNFGKPTQRIEESIVRLSKKGNEQLLTKIQTK